ncbi:MAG: tetratricopeptide repeat protein, partial [Bryobacterales bacterium]|nr:tetratricopeptide repeat protein [Bryobacterales bacterium]
LSTVAQTSPDPFNIESPWYTLGSAYLKVGDVQAARDLVRTRMEGDETPEALLIKGSLHLAEKRYGDALTLLERARSANPQLPMASSQIGVALLYEGRREPAAEAFRAELAINSRDFNANAFLGWLLEQDGYSERALELLHAAHGLQESDTGVKYLLAQSHATQRNWQEVATLLEDVTQVHPEFTPAHVMLARAYAKLKRTDLFRRQQGIIRRLNEEQQERDLAGVDQLYDGKVLALPSKGPDRRSPAQPRK